MDRDEGRERASLRIWSCARLQTASTERPRAERRKSGALTVVVPDRSIGHRIHLLSPGQKPLVSAAHRAQAMDTMIRRMSPLQRIPLEVARLSRGPSLDAL